MARTLLERDNVHEAFNFNTSARTPFSTYRDCFNEVRRDFSAAARLWSVRKWTSLPFLQYYDIPPEAADLITEKALTFDESIRSRHLFTLAPVLGNSIRTIFWSEGYANIQHRKIDTIEKLIAPYETNPDRKVVRLVGDDKLSLTGDLFKALYRMDLELSQQTPVIIFEDKALNITKFMEDALDTPVWQFTEEDLDRVEFPFDDYLTHWKNLIAENVKYFSRFYFIYVPPDKPIANGKDILSISPLREIRIRKWIEESNRVLLKALTEKGTIAVTPDVIPDHFIYLDDDVTSDMLKDKLPPGAIILTDLDGVLTSQENVLNSREELVTSAFNEVAQTAYQELFLMDLDQLYNLILSDGHTQDNTVWQLYEGQPAPVAVRKDTIERDSYPKGLRMELSISPTVIDRVRTEFVQEDKWGLRINLVRYDLEEKRDLSFFIDPTDFRNTLKSIGFHFPSSHNMLQYSHV